MAILNKEALKKKHPPQNKKKPEKKQKQKNTKHIQKEIETIYPGSNRQMNRN